MPAKTGRIAIVGGGPGGLTSAMLLAAKGLNVTLFEKGPSVGGRNNHLMVGQSKFDIGPTMLMMKFVLDQCFKDIGKKSEDYMKFYKLEPMYRLQFDQEKFIDCYSQHEDGKMHKEFERVFPNDTKGYYKWLEAEKKRYKYTIPLLQRSYSSLTDMVNMDAIKALPWLSLGRSVFNVLGDSFQDEMVKLSFSFQSKYLGMTPWECPGFFNIIPFVEHHFGVYHVEGGLSEISHAMARVIQKELNTKIELNTGVKRLHMEGKEVKGVVLENGEVFKADHVILNADFMTAMNKLIPDGDKLLKKWAPKKLPSKKYSCSTFMMYLQCDKLYKDIPHHNILFAKDYKSNMKHISDGIVPEDPSIYIRNASVTDPTLSPQGKSGIYVLVPVPNMLQQGDEAATRFWNSPETVKKFRNICLNSIETKMNMPGLSKSIEHEEIITPTMWHQRDVYKGAVFSLAHNMMQLLCFRPRNRFEELDNLYLVGAGTHPGSGLPTIYESARITSDLICKEYGIDYKRESFSL